MQRLSRRLLHSVKNTELLGQPSWKSHSHLLKAGEIKGFHGIDEYVNRRLDLAKLVPSKSITIIPSYGIKYGSQNIFFSFQQNNNLLYLTGFDEPESCLIIEKIDDAVKSHLFVKDNDSHALLWEGPRCGPERVNEYFGIENTSSLVNLASFVREKIKDRFNIMYDFDENSKLPAGLVNQIEQNGKSITEAIQAQRAFKVRSEVLLMKDACKKSAEAFKETMKWSVSEKVCHENSIAAKMDFECRLRGASGLAYVPVVASGQRSLILHYTRNNMVAQQDDLMFMDAGGKFDGYCTDISRAWPLNGRFSEPQRKIYEAVLRVQKACIKYCGMYREEQVNLSILNALSVYMTTEELKRLGFKNPERIVDKLYPHSIGHYLGLDLHDCPKISGDLMFRPGMVVTIEPGLYIPEDPAYPEEYHGVGIRIEDDVVIEEGGCTVMTEAVPKEVDEIEALLRS